MKIYKIVNYDVTCITCLEVLEAAFIKFRDPSLCRTERVCFTLQLLGFDAKAFELIEFIQ